MADRQWPQALQALHRQQDGGDLSTLAAHHEGPARDGAPAAAGTPHDQGDGSMIGAPCSCGSRMPQRMVNDARGIFLCYVCVKCEKRRLGVYRPEVFYDPNYPTTEPIEPE